MQSKISSLQVVFKPQAFSAFITKAKSALNFFNIEGNRKNQFSFWPQMRDLEVGHTGFFVDIEQAKQVDEPLGLRCVVLKQCYALFRQVQFLGR